MHYALVFLLAASAASASAFATPPAALSFLLSARTPAKGARHGGALRMIQDGAVSTTAERRDIILALGAGILSLNAPIPAVADSTGKFTSKRTAKNRYVPRIKNGLAFIKAGDAAGFSGVQEDMVMAMKLYGQAQRRGEVPDKISERLDKDTAAFAEAAKTGDIKAIKDAFLVYFGDLPTDGKEPFGTGLAPPPPTAVEK